MLDEPSKRRANFGEDAKLRLADGQEWSLAVPPTDVLASEAFHALIVGMREAESRSDQLRAEFALSIDLLTRNYDLSSADLQILYGFTRNSPELAEFQSAMHKIAAEVCIAAIQVGSDH